MCAAIESQWVKAAEGTHALCISFDRIRCNECETSLSLLEPVSREAAGQLQDSSDDFFIEVSLGNGARCTLDREGIFYPWRVTLLAVEYSEKCQGTDGSFVTLLIRSVTRFRSEGTSYTEKVPAPDRFVLEGNVTKLVKRISLTRRLGSAR